MMLWEKWNRGLTLDENSECPAGMILDLTQPSWLFQEDQGLRSRENLQSRWGQKDGRAVGHFLSKGISVPSAKWAMQVP